MSNQPEKKAASHQATTHDNSLLEQALSAAAKHTSREVAEGLIRALVQEANAGTIIYQGNVINSIRQGIAQIDCILSQQLAAIMHHEKFQTLEGTWRGLKYLVHMSQTDEMLKIHMLNCPKAELGEELAKTPNFEQSYLWEAIYENAFHRPGGTPYGLLVGDYQFDLTTPGDMDTLQAMAGIAAASFAPFVTTPSPSLFGLEAWDQLQNVRDLRCLFDAKKYLEWKTFRDSDDSRFVVMTLPRTLARLPYGRNTKLLDEFDFEEVETGPEEPIAVWHTNYCWMSTAYVQAATVTKAFSETNWCTAIRNTNNGGRVEGLPTLKIKSTEGDTYFNLAVEVVFTDPREKELSDLGFYPLCQHKSMNCAAFFRAQTCNKPKIYDLDAATENAAISARLPYIMASSRFAHFIKVMARDSIGCFKTADEIQDRLYHWIMRYVNACGDKPSEFEKARYPLRDARLQIKPIPDVLGAYNAEVFLRPWLQMEELNAAWRMVVRLPTLD